MFFCSRDAIFFWTFLSFRLNLLSFVLGNTHIFTCFQKPLFKRLIRRVAGNRTRGLLTYASYSTTELRLLANKTNIKLYHLFIFSKQKKHTIKKQTIKKHTIKKHTIKHPKVSKKNLFHVNEEELCKIQ